MVICFHNIASPGYVFLGQNAFYSAAVKRPVSNEYTIELQRQLPQETVFSAIYVHRETRRNIGAWRSERSERHIELRLERHTGS